MGQSLFRQRPKVGQKERVPLWFMRQAGRYHSHYQNIKKDSDFVTMCKDPKLACEITMGPMNDFDFDAAILFSDLLFPLEFLGLGLHYNDGPPKLTQHLRDKEDLKKIKPQGEAKNFFQFQKEALIHLKERLPKEKTLLGFVGAPFTLYAYAVEGSHSGSLVSTKTGLYDGRFRGFCEALFPPLLTEMSLQVEGGADAVCLFDTAVGELSLDDYQDFALHALKKITNEFKALHPNCPLIYYSKHTHLEYLKRLEEDSIDVLGVDWRHHLPTVLKELGKDYYIQGNIDPCWLHLPWETLEKKLHHFFQEMDSSSIDLSRWIGGLGHGVLIKTPEENVRQTVQWFQKYALY